MAPKRKRAVWQRPTSKESSFAECPACQMKVISCLLNNHLDWDCSALSKQKESGRIDLTSGAASTSSKKLEKPLFNTEPELNGHHHRGVDMKPHTGSPIINTEPEFDGHRNHGFEVKAQDESPTINTRSELNVDYRDGFGMTVLEGSPILITESECNGRPCHHGFGVKEHNGSPIINTESKVNGHCHHGLDMKELNVSERELTGHHYHEFEMKSHDEPPIINIDPELNGHHHGFDMEADDDGSPIIVKDPKLHNHWYDMKAHDGSPMIHTELKGHHTHHGFGMKAYDGSPIINTELELNGYQYHGFDMKEHDVSHSKEVILDNPNIEPDGNTGRSKSSAEASTSSLNKSKNCEWGFITASLPLKAPKGHCVLEDFISEKEEQDLVCFLDMHSKNPWKLSTFNGLHMNKTYGLITDLKRRCVQPAVFEMPKILLPILEKMRATVPVLKDFWPNETNAIDYCKNKGHWLKPHVDDRQLSGTILVNISLCGDCKMTYERERGPRESYKVLLRQRCIQILTGECRYNFTHCILNEDLLAARRVSMTFRQYLWS